MYKWNPFTNNLDEKGDWFFGGNTLGSKKTIGSIDNQDFGIITNNLESVTVLKNGNVGIGITNPSAVLDVNGELRARGQISLYDDNGDGNIFTPGGNIANYIDASGVFQFANANINVLSTNVGIGVTNPAYKLDIVTNSGQTAFFRAYGNGVSSASGYFTIQNATIGAGTFASIFKARTNSNFYSGLSFIGDTASGLDTGSNPIVEFAARSNNGVVNNRPLFAFHNYYRTAYGGNTVMQISANGNVGIGITTPTAKLDINSDILRLRTAKTPATAGASGNAGDICWDTNYIYVCVATNTWKRTSLETW